MDEAAVIGMFNDMAEEKAKQEYAEFCMTEHMKAVSNWKEGKIVKYWEEAHGVMCVQYESGNWWHYKNKNKTSVETGKPCLEWW